MPDNIDPMKMLDDFAKFVETMTGMKNQFIDAGWTPTTAELMVLQALKAGG